MTNYEDEVRRREREIAFKAGKEGQPPPEEDSMYAPHSAKFSAWRDGFRIFIRKQRKRRKRKP